MILFDFGNILYYICFIVITLCYYSVCVAVRSMSGLNRAGCEVPIDYCIPVRFEIVADDSRMLIRLMPARRLGFSRYA